MLYNWSLLGNAEMF